MSSLYKQGARYLWKVPEYNIQEIQSISAEHNISFPISQTLLTRGLKDSKAIQSFLFSSWEQDVAHPSLLKDAQKAVDRLLEAIQKHEPILICGDYDVDGITSSALMMTCLLPLQAKVNFFLPHRVKDGYGLSTKIVERAAKNGYKVIVTVDNGITAFDPALRAKELGIDLIITDHHRPHEHQPDAFAIINPNRQECPYPFKVFAGVGVSFKLISLLYEKLGRTIPQKAYELLLLGTVADVVPLVGENRFWVRYGLHHINKAQSLSFITLKGNSKLEKDIVTSTDIGFSITPQINALGRLEDPRQGVKFLLGLDPVEVQHVGRILFDLNEKRKGIELSIVADVEAKISSGEIDLRKEKVIIAASDTWPPGVIGLVASRFVSKYGRPTILLHNTAGGKAKGSCRSIAEFSMFDALQKCSDILDQFGGHSLAAGLSLDSSKIPLLKERLEKIISLQLTEFDLQQKLVLDAHMNLSDVNKKLVADLHHLEPFGNENSCPIFYFEKVCLVQKPVLLKDQHVKCLVFSEGIIKPVIFFNRPDLFEPLVALDQAPFSLAARVSENYWQNRVSIELMGLDVAF